MTSVDPREWPSKNWGQQRQTSVAIVGPSVGVNTVIMYTESVTNLF